VNQSAGGTHLRRNSITSQGKMECKQQRVRYCNQYLRSIRAR